MNESFIQKYMIGVIKAIIWVSIGCLTMMLVQKESGVIVNIIIFVVALVLIMVGELLFTMLEKKITTPVNVHTNNRVSSTKPAGTTAQATQVREENKLKESGVVPDKALQGVNANTTKDSRMANKVSNIVLLGEQMNVLLQWPLNGKTAIVIGKGTTQEPVDIDLSETAMAQMVSKQHAVLNYTDNGWYIDDVDSKNGTRVRKRNQSALLDVKLVGAVEVEAGDIIYIANTMLQLR